MRKLSNSWLHGQRSGLLSLYCHVASIGASCVLYVSIFWPSFCGALCSSLAIAVLYLNLYNVSAIAAYMHTPMCRWEQATPTESEMRSASQQHVWNLSSHDDSDSKDSQPLCNLAADSIPLGQLVAKRTPFQAFAARPCPQHAVEEALHDDRCVTCTLLGVVHLSLSM